MLKPFVHIVELAIMAVFVVEAPPLQEVLNNKAFSSVNP